MIIFNTTFHVDSVIEHDFIEWIKSEYIPQALTDGMRNPTFTKIMIGNDEGFSSFALHIAGKDAETIGRWSDNKMSELHSSAYKRWGERVLSFSTPMEIIEL